jgi:hypothetical protein
MKHLLIIISFAIIGNIAPSIGQTNEICDSPEITMCNRPPNEEISENFNRLKAEIAQEANKNSLRRFELELPKKGLLKTLRTYIAREKILNQEIIYAAERKLGHFEKDIVSKANIKDIKKFLTLSVKKSNLDEKYKAKFIEIINEKVIIGNYIDFMERTNVTNSYFKQRWRAHCGMDGMSVNAFATTADWKKYVLVCPGLLVKLNSLKNSKELNNEILFVLAHEIAHHFDSAKFPKAYESMAKCYQNEIAQKLNKTSGKVCEKDDSRCKDELKKRSEKTNIKCNAKNAPIEKRACALVGNSWNKMLFKRCKKGTGKSCLEAVTWKHLGEISADFWAAQTMGLYMGEKDFMIEEGTEFLRVNFETLCGSGDEGIHADSQMRGDYLIGQNPLIRNQLSCLPSTKNYCEI